MHRELNHSHCRIPLDFIKANRRLVGRTASLIRFGLLNSGSEKCVAAQKSLKRERKSARGFSLQFPLKSVCGRHASGAVHKASQIREKGGQLFGPRNASGITFMRLIVEAQREREREKLL